MLRIDVYATVHIKVDDHDERVELQKLLDKRLTYANPVYTAAIRTGRWVDRSIPKQIKGYSTVNGIFEVPRGFLRPLIRWCKDLGIEYRVRDRRIVRDAPKPFKYAVRTKLRPYQKEAVSSALRLSRDQLVGSEGILQAPCGSGKTLMLTDIFRQLGQWTLVLVHTDDLITQMKERLEYSLGIKVGLIKQNVMDIQPITVASVMTLMRRDLTKEFLETWGCIALDEAHHMPAESFTKVIKQFPARYRYGTTATAKRADGLHGLMFNTIGYRFFNITYETLYDEGYLMPADVYQIDTEFTFDISSGRNTRAYQAMLKAVIADPARNKDIIGRLLKSKKHHHLILSSRIDQLKLLRKMLIKGDPKLRKRSALLIGEMKGVDRREVLQKMADSGINYIFATQLADEGLDNPILDRLSLVFPTRSERKIQQELGRIQRVHPGKTNAVCWDYRDSHVGVLDRQADARVKVYNQTGCRVKRIRSGTAPKELMWTLGFRS